MNAPTIKRYNSPESNIKHAIDHLDKAISFTQGPEVKRWWQWRVGLIFTDTFWSLFLITLTISILFYKLNPAVFLPLGISSAVFVFLLSVRKTQEENFSRNLSKQAVEYGLWLEDNNPNPPSFHYLDTYPASQRLRILELLTAFPSTEHYEELKNIAVRDDVPYVWWTYVGCYAKIFHKQQKDRDILDKIKQLP